MLPFAKFLLASENVNCIRWHLHFGLWLITLVSLVLDFYLLRSQRIFGFMNPISLVPNLHLCCACASCFAFSVNFHGLQGLSKSYPTSRHRPRSTARSITRPRTPSTSSPHASLHLRRTRVRRDEAPSPIDCRTQSRNRTKGATAARVRQGRDVGPDSGGP